MMRKKEILYSLVFVTISIVLFYIFKPSKYEMCFEAYDQTIQMEYKGIISNKYLDATNHWLPTIIVKSMNDSISIIDFRDRSGFYEYAIIGDSVEKVHNNPDIRVCRNGEVKTFRINYDCNDR